MEIKPIILLMSSLCSVLFPRSGSSPAGPTKQKAAACGFLFCTHGGREVYPERAPSARGESKGAKPGSPPQDH